MKLEEKQQRKKRFKIAHREAKIGIGLALFHFIWWFGFAYGFGSKSVKEYTYIMGFPTWFFYSCIVGFILIVLLVVWIVNVYFTDIPFEDESGGENS